MSVDDCKGLYYGGYGELANPLQWPQLRKKTTPCCSDNNKAGSSTATPLRSKASQVLPDWPDRAADPIRNRASVATLIPTVDSFSDPPPKTPSTKGIFFF